MKVSVIIPTYNRAHLIGITIDSFLNLNFPKNEYEIIVVDNNSTDSTKDVVMKYSDKVKYIFEPRQGNHFARNTASKSALGDILYFTDDDMIADPELMNELMTVMEFDQRIAVVTGKVLPKWQVPPPKWVAKHLTNQFLSLMDLREVFMITKQIDLLYSCHYAIKRDVFFEVEGFNPEQFGKKRLGDGETGLNIKIQKRGYLFGYNAKSIIYHIIPANRMTQKYLNKRIGINGGISHSYTKYRANSSYIKLINRTFVFLPIKAVIHIIYLLLKTVYKKDFAYIRFALSYIVYYYNCIKFNYKLFTRPLFRKLVLKTDWLSNDNEYDIKDIMKII